MEITIKPAQNRAVADEQGTFITNTQKVVMNEYWARRLMDGDVVEVKEKGKGK